MHEKGKKSCPICTEEMDLTDQQLKPCKCGYEICVWCWHHIMEMSEKDGGCGRCPACRAPYDKERIVAMAANCRRLVAEMNSQRKKKMQKLKPKSSEEKKHLSDVRVIQRNMVYIMGLPLNIADEDLLQHREYFGRYGKVLKVSISRTATGLVQHSENNNFCVYVTYSKEAEAIRCIQSVHCFVLEGRCLRACYGTTKYCHAWLRNLPCRNRDCMYLHDYGSQEDSFTKDDLALALARSRVHQIIGATNNLNWRSGNVLPPQEDDCRHMSSASKVVFKSSSDKTASESHTKVSCSGGPMSSAAPSAVPSWAMRVSGSLPPVSSSSCSGNLANRKVGVSNGPQLPVSVVNTTERSALNTRRSEKDKNSSEVHSGGLFIPLEVNKHNIGGNSQTFKSDVNEAVNVEKLPSTVLSSCENSLGAFMGNDELMLAPAVSTSFRKLSKQQCDFNADETINLNSNGDVQGSCSELSSISMHGHLEDSYSIPDSDRLHFTLNSMDSSMRQHFQEDDHYSNEHSTTPALWEDIIVDDMLNLDHEQSNFCKGISNLSAGSCSPGLPQNVDQSSHHLWEQDQLRHQHHLGKPSESFNQHLETGYGKHVESKDNVNMVASDVGESSIISNILSLELDACEDSLVKLLAESEEPCRPIISQTLLKVQDKDQSSFSFARQDDFMNEASDLEQSFGITRHVSRGNFASNGLMVNDDTLTARYTHVTSSNSAVSDKFIGISKSHASPPGFPMSSRIPPPGFSCGRVTHDSSTPVKHPQLYGLPSGNVGRIGNAQVNNDGAILEAFRTGMLAERLNSTSFNMRQSLLPQYSPAEHDAARLMLLMQQSLPSQYSRLPDLAENRFSLQNDAYSSRFLDQFQPNNPSIYEQLHSQQFSSNVFPSNSQPTWHDTKNFSGLPMSQVLDNQRMGFNNFMPSYENIKF